MPNNQLTITGNLTTNPELKYTPNGKPVTTITIASNERRKNQHGEYETISTLYLRATIWGQTAENAAATLTKGTHIIATCTLNTRQWENRDGQKQTTTEAIIEHIGPTLTNQTAQITKTNQPHTPNPNRSNEQDPWTTQPTDQPPY